MCKNILSFPRPLTSQVFRFALASSSLAIPSAPSTIEEKYVKIKSWVQSTTRSRKLTIQKDSKCVRLSGKSIILFWGQLAGKSKNASTKIMHIQYQIPPWSTYLRPSPQLHRQKLWFRWLGNLWKKMYRNYCVGHWETFEKFDFLINKTSEQLTLLSIVKNMTESESEPEVVSVSIRRGVSLISMQNIERIQYTLNWTNKHAK